MKTVKRKVISILALVLLNIQFILGTSNGITPKAFTSRLVGAGSGFQSVLQAVNKAVTLLSGLMTLPVLENANVQAGFIRLGLFLMVFSLANWGLKKSNLDPKSAGVISFVVGFTGAALMPMQWVLLNGGIFAIIVGSVVPLGLIGFLIWAAIDYFKADKNGDGWWKELVGFLILLLLLTAIIPFIKNGLGTGLSTSKEKVSQNQSNTNNFLVQPTHKLKKELIKINSEKLDNREIWP